MDTILWAIAGLHAIYDGKVSGFLWSRFIKLENWLLTSSDTINMAVLGRKQKEGRRHTQARILNDRKIYRNPVRQMKTPNIKT